MYAPVCVSLSICVCLFFFCFVLLACVCLFLCGVYVCAFVNMSLCVGVSKYVCVHTILLCMYFAGLGRGGWCRQWVKEEGVGIGVRWGGVGGIGA